MRSSDPPITIPAWMVMTTGKDAGRLGLYGFRHRTGYSYDKMWIATAQAFKERAIWDIVGDNGGQSVLVSIPPSYPPRKVPGHLIGCFITPDTDKDYTYPPELKAEIESKFGPYLFDVVFRTEDRDEILREIYAMTEKRFEVIALPDGDETLVALHVRRDRRGPDPARLLEILSTRPTISTSRGTSTRTPSSIITAISTARSPGSARTGRRRHRSSWSSPTTGRSG